MWIYTKTPTEVYDAIRKNMDNLHRVDISLKVSLSRDNIYSIAMLTDNRRIHMAYMEGVFAGLRRRL